MKFLFFFLFMVCHEIMAQDFMHKSNFLSDSGHVVWLTKNEDPDFDLNCKRNLSGFTYGTSYYQGTDSISKLQFLSIPVKNPKVSPNLLLDQEDTIWENIEKINIYSAISTLPHPKIFVMFILSGTTMKFFAI